MQKSNFLALNLNTVKLGHIGFLLFFSLLCVGNLNLFVFGLKQFVVDFFLGLGVLNLYEFTFVLSFVDHLLQHRGSLTLTERNHVLHFKFTISASFVFVLVGHLLEGLSVGQIRDFRNIGGTLVFLRFL